MKMSIREIGYAIVDSIQLTPAARNEPSASMKVAEYF
jgi:hypothetical protein